MSTSLHHYPQPLQSTHLPITNVVPPIPTILGDSTEESEPGVDFLKYVRPEYKTPDDYANDYAINGQMPGWDKPKPYAGQGRPLREAIKEAWATWRDMLYSDAESGNTEAAIDLAMALWRGDANYQIEQDRKEAVHWIKRASTQGRHEINPAGNCGIENCFKCFSQVLERKMTIWYADEERQKNMSAAQIIALYTPHLLFQILSYCDVETLGTLSSLNSLWHEIIKDPRAWSHINMLETFPLPIIPTELLPNDSPLLLQHNSLPDNHQQLSEAQRDSKDDFLLFRQLPPPHRNLCRVCNQTIIPPEQNADSLYANPDGTYSQGYMIEATTIPDPFWKFFACHRECFFDRAQDTITPYTLQGMKTLVFQGELKHEATEQITWEKHVFRRIEATNIKQLSLQTLAAPVQPKEYDEYKTWCDEYRKMNPDLLSFAEDHLDHDEDDEDEDFEHNDESEDDFEQDPEAYGKQIAEHLQDAQEDDESDIDLDGFLNGDKFSLLEENDMNQNDFWLSQIQKNKSQIRQYWTRLHLVEWYEKTLKQYNQLSNLFLAYSSGLIYSPYTELYCKQMQNSQEQQLSQPTAQESLAQKLDYYFFSYPQSFPPRKRAIEVDPYSSQSTTNKIRLSDLPTIIPPILACQSSAETELSSTNTTTPNATNLFIKSAPNPYEIPSTYDHLLQNKYPQHNFIIDNTPLWHVLTNFTQYRKYAKLFHQFDDVVVEYPTRQQYLFAHGDSRYGDVNRNPYQISTIDDYVHPTKQALPIVYELFQLLLRSSTGFRYLQYRQLVLKELLPRFNLKYDSKTKTVVEFPGGQSFVEKLAKKKSAE